MIYYAVPSPPSHLIFKWKCNPVQAYVTSTEFAHGILRQTDKAAMTKLFWFAVSCLVPGLCKLDILIQHLMTVYVRMYVECVF